MTPGSADETGRKAGGEAPESAAPDEAMLMAAWAESLEAAPDVPEDVLGLLDGTLDAKDAARVRRRLAENPRLAKAAGDLVASGRAIDPAADVAPLPGRLMAEVLDLVPPAVEAPSRRGLLARLADAMRSAALPGVATAVAGALLVTFVILERDQRPPTDAGLRAGAVAPTALSLESPLPDAVVSGALDLRWQALPGAVRYRVVLVDAATGDVTDAGHTDAPQLTIPADTMAAHFGRSRLRSLHWIVRARLLDGTEVSSEPRRLTWSAH